MKKMYLFRKRKAEILSIFIVFLLCSVSIAAPATNDKNVRKIIDKNNVFLSDFNNGDFSLDELFKTDLNSYHEIISYLKESAISDKNYVLLSLISYLDDFFRDFGGKEFLEQFPNFFEFGSNYFSNNNANLIDISQNSMNLRNDVVSFARAIDYNFGEISADDLLSQSVSKSTYDSFQLIIENYKSKITSNDNLQETNFSGFLEQYSEAKEYWADPTTFGGNSDSIDSWFLNMQEWMFGIEYDDYGNRLPRSPSSFLLVSVSTLAIIITVFAISLFNQYFEMMTACVFLIAIWIAYIGFQLWKLFEGYYRALNMIQNQISFSIRVVDVNGTGIENLESYYFSEKDSTDHTRLQGYIKISNQDALDCAWSEDFEYYLGPAFGKDEPGWYSVSTWNPSGYDRGEVTGDDPDLIGYNWKYFRAPPAPGTYKIELENSTGDPFIVNGLEYLKNSTFTNEIGFFGDYSHTIKLYEKE